MRISASAQPPEAAPDHPWTGGGPWYTTPRAWAAVAVVAFLLILFLPMALAPKPQWAELTEPRLACEVIDWRVGEKLAVMAEREDPRSRAIVGAIARQRETAQATCRAGEIDTAMTLYRVLDRALTRYVQHGTAPALPK